MVKCRNICETILIAILKNLSIVSLSNTSKTWEQKDDLSWELLNGGYRDQGLIHSFS